MREDIDELMALHDGELPAEDAAKAGERHNDDPESRQFLEKLAEADKAFADAADELLEMPVPAKLIEAIRNPQPEPQPELEPEPAQQSAEIIPFPRRRGIVGFAIAAGLAAVIATNTQLFQSPTDAVTDAAPAGYAALLQEAMESVPSGEVRSSEDGSISIMPMVSFKTDAAYCREFTTQRGGAQFSGVACRDAVGSWEQLSQQSIATAPEDGEYRAAEGQEGGVELPPELARAAELSYAEEQAAIRSGWTDSGL